MDISKILCALKCRIDNLEEQCGGDSGVDVTQLTSTFIPKSDWDGGPEGPQNCYDYSKIITNFLLTPQTNSDGSITVNKNLKRVYYDSLGNKHSIPENFPCTGNEWSVYPEFTIPVATNDVAGLIKLSQVGGGSSPVVPEKTLVLDNTNISNYIQSVTIPGVIFKGNYQNSYSGGLLADSVITSIDYDSSKDQSGFYILVLDDLYTAIDLTYFTTDAAPGITGTGLYSNSVPTQYQVSLPPSNYVYTGPSLVGITFQNSVQVPDYHRLKLFAGVGLFTGRLSFNTLNTYNNVESLYTPMAGNVLAGTLSSVTAQYLDALFPSRVQLTTSQQTSYTYQELLYRQGKWWSLFY